MNAFEKFAEYERMASLKLVSTIAATRRIAAGIAQPPETEITLTDVVMIGLVGLVAVATCLLVPDHVND